MKYLIMLLAVLSLGFVSKESLDVKGEYNIVSGSYTVKNSFQEAINAKDVEIKILEVKAPNGTLYQIGKVYYSPKLGKRYVEITRKPDFASPIRRGLKTVGYKWLPVEKKIKPVDIETTDELVTAIKDELGITAVGPGGFGQIGYLILMGLAAIAGLIGKFLFARRKQ